MKRFCTIALALIMFLLSLSACQKKSSSFTYGVDNTEYTRSNAAMGTNLFDLRDDYVYFSDRGTVYEYDIETGKTIAFEPPWAFIWGYLSVHPGYVTCRASYNGFTNYIAGVTRDGKTMKALLSKETMRTGPNSLYMEEDYCYYCSANGFCRTNLVTQEEEILFGKKDVGDAPYAEDGLVESFYVTDDRYYIIVIYDIETAQETGRFAALWTSDRKELHFEEIQIENPADAPIRILPVGDILYAVRINPFTVYTMTKEGKFIENLPEEISAWNCRVIGDKLYYIDIMDEWKFYVYDMKSNEIELLFEPIVEFSVLSDKYLGLLSKGGSNAYLYNMETGETIDMLAEECFFD